MKLQEQVRLASSRQRVWDALNDAEVLRQCIPGCQSLERESTDEFRALVEIKIGPIGARFNSTITLSDVQPSSRYTLVCEGHGGTVGSGKAIIEVRLSDDGVATLLSYDVDAQVGGRLAQLGGPIVDATAKQLAAKFFRKFGEIVGSDDASIGISASTNTPSSGRRWSAGEGASPIAWVLIAVIAALAGFWIGRATKSQVVLDKPLLEKLLENEKRGAP